MQDTFVKKCVLHIYTPRQTPWGVDVQDTFFDSGRKCVAMVTAYYGKNGEKSCVANYFLSFSPILMKFGTDVCLGV